MNASTLATVSDMPTDSELRASILAIINARYDKGGVKAFAADAGLPYDRVRDHISGKTNWKVADLLTYCQALDVSFDDLFRMRDALRAARPTD